MAGRIRDADIARVRERSPIADIVGEHVGLRRAGGGSLKGLCPFHEERSPSFNVSPERGFFHCFGCGEGGDVISFVQKAEQLTFAEAVERLARRAGIELTYEQGGAAPRQQQGQRTRLLGAHAAAQQFYADQLRSPEAAAARKFLTGRGFPAQTWDSYGVGYAPGGWDVLVRHLTAAGFSREELLTGGLVSQGRHGPIDRFRDRLVWPIRDKGGEVVAFGARRLREDDSGAKYLNSPETPIYRKSSVLYGLDLAKKEIARRHQAVVVEGYTDVMACHLAGVPTAVATCGTAFGPEHVAALRPILMDQDEFRGEVVFTFDGDSAGQKAALRAFAADQRFVGQTFVSVEPDGLDPCDLRLRRGDAAVRDLVARRVPLFEFALREVLDRYNLDTAEGQLAALDAAAPIVAGIKDHGLRQRYAVNLDRWLGLLDEGFILRRVAEQAGRRPAADNGRAQQPRRPQPSGVTIDRADPVQAVQREALKLAVQRPAVAGPVFDGLDSAVFTVPAYAAVHDTVTAAGGVGTNPGGADWVSRLRELAGDDGTRALVTELAVEPLHTTVVDAGYSAAVLARLTELHLTRVIQPLKAKLQRMSPVEEPASYNRLAGQLWALEQQRHQLRERGVERL